MIDRSKARDNPLMVVAASKPHSCWELALAETILASVPMRAHQQAAHMHASDPIKISAYTSCKREPSTYAMRNKMLSYRVAVVIQAGG